MNYPICCIYFLIVSSDIAGAQVFDELPLSREFFSEITNDVRLKQGSLVFTIENNEPYHYSLHVDDGSEAKTEYFPNGRRLVAGDVVQIHFPVDKVSILNRVTSYTIVAANRHKALYAVQISKETGYGLPRKIKTECFTIVGNKITPVTNIKYDDITEEKAKAIFGGSAFFPKHGIGVSNSASEVEVEQTDEGNYRLHKITSTPLSPHDSPSEHLTQKANS